MNLRDFFNLEGAPTMAGFARKHAIPISRMRLYVQGHKVRAYMTAKKISEGTRIHPTLPPLVSIEELCE